MQERHGTTAIETALQLIDSHKKETPTGQPNVQAMQEVRVYLNSVKDLCEKLDMQASAKQVWELELTLKSLKPNLTEISTFLTTLLRTMNGELNTRIFAYIPQTKTDYMEQDALFGDDVNKKFPTAAPEIKAAGNCIAADLNTAAVFHFMRATEVGLRALANHLGVKTVTARGKPKPVDSAMWGEIISHIQGNMQSLVQGATTQEKKENTEFHNEMLLVCNAFKELWRNPVSHSTKTFDEYDVLGVFGNVKRFMIRLSSRIQEVP
jgi:hypothetical protein